MILISQALGCAGWLNSQIYAVDINIPTDHPTIQAAIDAAADGDVIILAQDTYTGDGNCDLIFSGKKITIRSTEPDDPDIVAATIIDCDGNVAANHRAFIFNNSEDSEAVVDGLTIQNGYHENGGAVWCWNTSPSINRCVFKNNTSVGIGGAVACQNEAMVTIAGCIFQQNQALFVQGSISGVGGAVACDSSSEVYLSNAIISDNYAQIWGGAVYLDQSLARVENCIFSGNYAVNFGGAVYGNLSDILITNCSITENRAEFRGGAISASEGTMTIIGSIVWNNEILDTVTGIGPQIKITGDEQDELNVQYSNIDGGVAHNEDGLQIPLTGNGNIDSDPLFITNGSWSDNGTPEDFSDDIWTGGDYRLLDSSPCRNAGDDSVFEREIDPVLTDLVGTTRKLGSGVDMGVYEMTPPDGPDITGEFYSNSLYDVMVPFDKGKISVLISNVGNADAIATTYMKIYLSSDTFFDTSDIELATATVKLKLKAGASKAYKASVIIPADVATGSYYLLAKLDSNNDLIESDDSLRSNIAVDSTVRELAWKFGAIPNRKAVKLKLLDATGAFVTFSLSVMGLDR